MKNKKQTVSISILMNFQKEVIEKYAGINREKAICDTSHLILYEKRIENPLLHHIEVSIEQYKYDVEKPVTMTIVGRNKLTTQSRS